MTSNDAIWQFNRMSFYLQQDQFTIMLTVIRTLRTIIKCFNKKFFLPMCYILNIFSLQTSKIYLQNSQTLDYNESMMKNVLKLFLSNVPTSKIPFFVKNIYFTQNQILYSNKYVRENKNRKSFFFDWLFIGIFIGIIFFYRSIH